VTSGAYQHWVDKNYGDRVQVVGANQIVAGGEGSR
jgi:hypothetical protein